jgi:tetratricopeptide (TPR) repeat protein
LVVSDFRRRFWHDGFVSKRLLMLEKMTSSGSRDPFAWYGLALEYRTLGRLEDAVRTFHTLREIDAGYVPAYLMAAQTLKMAARLDDAREWVKAGIAAAQAKGDSHALSELESFAAEVGA